MTSTLTGGLFQVSRWLAGSWMCLGHMDRPARSLNKHQFLLYLALILMIKYRTEIKHGNMTTSSSLSNVTVTHLATWFENQKSWPFNTLGVIRCECHKCMCRLNCSVYRLSFQSFARLMTGIVHTTPVCLFVFRSSPKTHSLGTSREYESAACTVNSFHVMCHPITTLLFLSYHTSLCKFVCVIVPY